MTCDECCKEIAREVMEKAEKPKNWKCSIGIHSWGYRNGICRHEDGYMKCIYCNKKDEGGM